jgi:hypothetical protein
MNQTNAKDLVLTKSEAQNIHADIFDLLAQIQSLTEIRAESEVKALEPIDVEFDGGNF